MVGKNSPTAKEILFCYYCARLGNASEAAIRAGYSAIFADRHAARLLERGDILEKIAKYSKANDRQRLAGLAMQGLERLAFGAVNDAIALIFNGGELNPEQLCKLDLFGVSNIKQAKGGGFEIEFFDRIKVLELMLSSANRTQGSTQEDSFYSALEKGAAAANYLECEGGEV